MNKRERNRCLKKRRKEVVRRWKAAGNRKRSETNRARGKKKRYPALVLAFACMSLETASAKGWRPAENGTEIRVDQLPALIEIRPFCEEELRRDQKNAGHTEQGISLFFKEGRLVYFRVREAPADD